MKTNLKLIIFTAPSGAGKTTIVKSLLEKFDKLFLSITYTTRIPREGEMNGIDYNFIDVSKFREKIKEDFFLEWEEVYENQFYGSSKKIIDENHSKGIITMMIIDVKGALKIKEIYGDDALTVFVKVSDLESLRKRLVDRGTENEASINKRIARASEELLYESKYDYVLLNDVLNDAVNTISKEIKKYVG